MRARWACSACGQRGEVERAIDHVKSSQELGLEVMAMLRGDTARGHKDKSPDCGGAKSLTIIPVNTGDLGQRFADLVADELANS